MKAQKKIAIVSGTRAEFGLLRPLMEQVRDSAALHLQLIATGSHLSPEFGLTYREIERAGFSIDERVEILLSSDSSVGVAKSTGLAIMGLAEAYERLAPDWIVVLGDRFEIVAAALAAAISRIPVAHIHGGEVTEGAFDEGFRHAITKLSSLHFTANEVYRRRVIQLGESPDHVFVVGAPGLDTVLNAKLLAREALEESLGESLAPRNALVTFHPVTLEKGSSLPYLRALAAALEDFPDLKIFFTYPNADTEGRIIIDQINRFVDAHSGRAAAYSSLGQLRYLSLVKAVDLVIGNSSSGIIEAPSLNTPTVNIGDRQKGRLRAESVIDVGTTPEEISVGIRRALSPEFQRRTKQVTNPYGEGQAATRMLHILEGTHLDASSLKKSFYDLPPTAFSHLTESHG